MRRLKRTVERNRKGRRIVAGMACAALAASLAITGPALSVYADGTGIYAPVSEDVSFADCTTIDIRTAKINSNGVIAVKIDSSGSYRLTGNNIRNDAYVDVEIYVSPGVTANLLLDNLDIVNGMGLEPSLATTIPGAPSGQSPIVVDGTANVYIKSNSSIKTASNLFRVSGVLNFVKSEGDAQLTCGVSQYLEGYTMVDASTGSGLVSFWDANVKIDGSTESRKEMLFESNVYIPRLNVVFDNVVCNQVITDIYCFPESMGLRARTVKNMDGDTLYFYETITGLPAGAEVVQINNDLISDLSVNSEGKIENIYLLESSNSIYVKSGESCQRYIFWNSEEPEGDPVNAFYVKLTDSETGEVMKSYYIASGEKVKLLEESNQYSYSYALDEFTAVTNETTVNSDMNIIVTKSDKEKISVTIDGEEIMFNYGQTLGDLGFTSYYVDDSGNLVSSGIQVTEPITLTTVGLEAEMIGEKIYFKLGRSEDVKAFADLVTNKKATALNAYLSADVTIDNSFDMIGSRQNAYKGTFDGRNHTVTLNLDKPESQHAGFFGCVTCGAIIKNVRTAGTVKGNKNVGALVGLALDDTGARVLIEKCINTADVRGNQGYIGGLVGGTDYDDIYKVGELVVVIESCANRGKVECEAESESRCGGISGCVNRNAVIRNCYDMSGRAILGYDYTKVINCYSLESGADSTVKSAESFESGEVAYLLNERAGSTIWFQTCGTGAPELSGDTVYCGYENCETESVSYANTPFTKTEKGHHDNKVYYYENGKIITGCMDCDEEITADIVIPMEKLSKKMKGVTVNYSEQWEKAGYPEILIKYAETADGEYSEKLPAKKGTWYVRAYIGDDVVAINDTYVVKPADKKPGKNEPAGEPKDDVGQKEMYNRLYIESLDNLTNQILSMSREKSEGVKIISFAEGDSLPVEVIEALSKSPDVILDFRCTFKGVKYHYRIKGGFGDTYKKDTPWFGPIFLKSAFGTVD